MAKKTKKRQADIEVEEEPKPFQFMDSYRFVWNGHEWQIEHLGERWLTELMGRSWHFNFTLYEEFGLVGGWCTIAHTEQQIMKCWRHPVFRHDPDPIFLRKWLDEWIELHYCLLWQHVFKTLLSRGIEEFDAAFRADQIAFQFEALYEPTFPRVPVKPKPRRGSKRAKANAAAEAPPEAPVAYVKPVQPEDMIELHGPHPSPLLSYDRCYRILDRGDAVDSTVYDGTPAGFYDGARVVALLAGNDLATLRVAADIACREIKRRLVYKRLNPPEPGEPIIDVAGDTDA